MQKAQHKMNTNPKHYNRTTAIEVQPSNSLLRHLPTLEWSRLSHLLQPTLLYQGQVLHDVDQVVQRVYFVNAGLVSLTLSSEDGSEVEVGVVGREGVIGTSALIGEGRAITRAVVQIPGKALAMPADALRDSFKRGGQFQELMLRYMNALLSQTAQTALCNRLHSVEERLCRWLLVVRDRMGSDELEITQEFIAQMLGVRRSGVTIAAGSLRQAGMIDYTRGCIRILQSETMQSCTCRCYPIFRDLFHNLYS
jgi:CRP-like cAMP-binding protein